jgi:hypothetical protein
LLESQEGAFVVLCAPHQMCAARRLALLLA